MDAPRLILFDIDGTLVDAGGSGRRALLLAFGEVFGPLAEERAGTVRFSGKTDPVICAELAAALGVEPGRLGAAAPALRRAYTAALERELRRDDERPLRVLPGVRPLLDRLAARADARVGLLTGNIEEGARLKLARFELESYFEGGAFGDDGRDRREVARAARDDMARRCGVDFDAGDVVVVGDTGHDVDCARAHGFRSVAVETGWAEPDELSRAAPDAMFADLGDTETVLDVLFDGRPG